MNHSLLICTCLVLILHLSSAREQAHEKVSSAVKEAEKDKEIWVEEEDVDSMQGDSPWKTLTSCPKIWGKATRGPCQARQCRVDSECGQFSQKCCFNGCVRTCMYVTHPIVVDWMTRPKKQNDGTGLSWLVSTGEEEQIQEEEPCSTTVTGDERPLQCPHGYFCDIIEAANPDEGVPNSGVCKKGDQKEPLTPHHHHRGRGKCNFNGNDYHHGDTFFYQKLKCSCRHGRIQCEKNGTDRK